MKKIFIAVIALGTVTFISSCAKDRIKGCTNPYAVNYNPQATDDDGSCFVPSADKHALMGDFTGTWCPWCGEWGGPEFDNAISIVGSSAVPIAIHTGDEMSIPESEQLDDYYQATSPAIVTGWPTLYVWNEGTFTSGSSMAAAVSAENAVTPADAGATADFSINGPAITMTVSAQLFADVTGDYFVSAYLMENGINIPQEVESLGPGLDNSWIHNHVIRASSNGNAWGEQWVFGSGQNGQVFTKSYQITLDPSWNTSKLYCVAIVWKHDSSTDTYTFVNAQSSEGI